MATRPFQVAVLTGDLKDSSRAKTDAVETAVEALRVAAINIGQWSPENDLQFTRFRGDGWQVCLEKPAYLALRAALVFAASLRAAPSKLGTRIAIGVGPIDFIGRSNLSDARGAAFEYSGHALDGIGPAMLTIAGAHVHPLQNTLLQILGERIQRWSPEQAQATALALDPCRRTLQDISLILGISKQAVSYRLNGAGFPTLRQALKEWEADQEQLLAEDET